MPSWLNVSVYGTTGRAPRHHGSLIPIEIGKVVWFRLREKTPFIGSLIRFRGSANDAPSRPCCMKPAWNSHCASKDIAGRHVQACAHALPHPDLVRLQRVAARAWVADCLVRPIDALARGTIGQAQRAAGLQRYRYSDMPDHCPAGHHAVMSRKGSRSFSACRFVSRQASSRACLKLAGLDWPVPFVGRSFHWRAR